MKKLSNILFLQNFFILLLFGCMLVALSYFTTYRALINQNSQEIVKDYIEIKEVSDNLQDTLNIIKLELSTNDSLSPYFTLYKPNGVQFYNSDINILLNNQERMSNKNQLLTFVKDKLLLFIKEDNKGHTLYKITYPDCKLFVIFGRLKDNNIFCMVEENEVDLDILKESFYYLSFYSILAILMLCILSKVLSMQSLKSIQKIINAAKQVSSLNLQEKKDTITEYQVLEKDDLSFAFNEVLSSIDQTINEVFELTDNMSHDFKSSLHRIQILTENLILEGNLQESNTDLEKINIECNRLNHLLTTVLDISRFSTGVVQLNNSQFKVHQLLLDLIDLYEFSFQEKEIELIIEIDEFELYFDKELLTRVLSNLFENALRYCKSKGVFTIKSYVKDAKVFFVFDNSSEIYSKDDYLKIFTRFYQVDKSRHHNGYGLGLNLCKSITEKLNGQISAESSEIGFQINLSFPTL